MPANLISVSQCATLAGLAAEELIVGVTPTELHNQLYKSYVLDAEIRPDVLRDRIVADIRRCLDIGAQLRAADLLIVLRRVLARGARIARNASTALPRNPRSAKNSLRSHMMGGLRVVSSNAISVGGRRKGNVFSLEEYRRKLRPASAFSA